MQIDERAAEEIVQRGHTFLMLDPETQEAISRTYQAGYAFFRSSPEQKLQSILPDDCGYRPKGIEYSQSEDHPDEMESFSVTALGNTDVEASPEGRALYQQMCKAIELLEAIAEQIAVELAKKTRVDVDPSTIRGAFRRWSYLQLNYSRPSDCPAELINDPHEDGHLLTLATADAPGLEIQTENGGFAPVQGSHASLIVMPGETAWLMSGGLFRPLYHQVRRHPEVSERLALVYFGDLDPAFSEPWIRNEINKDIDIGARTRANSSRFGLQGLVSDEYVLGE